MPGEMNRLVEAYRRRNEAMKANRERRRQKVADEEVRTGSQIGNRAAQGAAIGGAIVPGWGHLAGASAGQLAGTYEDFQTRKDSGEDTKTAMQHTFVDAINPFKQIPDPRTMFQVAPSATSSIGAAQRKYGDKKQSSSAGLDSMADSDFQLEHREELPYTPPASAGHDVSGGKLQKDNILNYEDDETREMQRVALQRANRDDFLKRR